MGEPERRLIERTTLWGSSADGVKHRNSTATEAWVILTSAVGSLHSVRTNYRVEINADSPYGAWNPLLFAYFTDPEVHEPLGPELSQLVAVPPVASERREAAVGTMSPLSMMSISSATSPSSNGRAWA